jgi:protein SCO1/2
MQRSPSSTFNRSLALPLLLCGAALLGAAACRSREEAAARRYPFKGKVVAVDKERKLVTVSHEAIPDFMDAMTMPFPVKDDRVLNDLAPGDTVQATLAVGAERYWLENIIITRGEPAKDGGGAQSAAEPAPGTAVPDFKLINQDNKRIHLGQYRGRALLVTFIYTRCPLPEYCTLMSNNFAEIDRELEKKPALRAKTHQLTISFDPAYDTPKVLRSYGAGHTGRFADETFEHWEFATGTPEEVRDVARFFGLTYEEDGDQIIHSLRTAIIAPDGKLYKIYRGNDWKPAEVLRDLDELLNHRPAG